MINFYKKKESLTKIIVFTYFLLTPILSFAQIEDEIWIKKCVNENKDCLIFIKNQVDMEGSDKKNTVATAYIRLGSSKKKKLDLIDGEEKTNKLKEGNKIVPILFLQLPLNVDLRKNPLITIDETSLFNMSYTNCNSTVGCVSSLAINDKAIKLFISGKELLVTFGIPGQSENTLLKFPLKGFSKSYKDLLK